MTRDKMMTYGFVAVVGIAILVLGGTYWRVTSQPIGDECPRIAVVPEGVEMQDRVRSEQRLDTSFDVRPALDGTDLSCTKIFGQAKCETTGPAIMSAHLGFNGEPEIYQIPAERSAVVTISASRFICVMLDPE